MTTHNDNIDYLGDGVYAHFDGYSIGLSVNTHRDEPAVWLEPQVLAALNQFAQRMIQQVQADD
jgi:hypothetical protein